MFYFICETYQMKIAGNESSINRIHFHIGAQKATQKSTVDIWSYSKILMRFTIIMKKQKDY